MYFEEISDNLLMNFSHLAPGYVISRGREKNIRNIGGYTADTSKEGKENAFFQFRETENTFELLWIYVADESRNSSFGSNMLKILFELAAREGKRKVTALVYNDLISPADSDRARMSEFLLSHGFDEKRSDTAPVIISGKQIASGFLLQDEVEVASARPFVGTLKGFTGSDLENAAKSLGLGSIHAFDMADKNFSVLYESKGDFFGAIIILREGRRLVVSKTIAPNENVLEKMAVFVCDLLSKDMVYSYKYVIEKNNPLERWMLMKYPYPGAEGATLLIRQLGN